MPNNKHLLTLDDECADILKESANKSEFVRKAIKYYNRVKDQVPTYTVKLS